MVKLATLAVAALAVFAPIAEARNCRKGLTYCGYVLLRRGNYYNQIEQELSANGKSTSSDWIKNSLFECTGGSNGDINYLRKCGDCKDGGDKHNDYC
ncbi:hypothetical protein ACJ41O_012520 [Fusarium nematophilum]